MRIETNKRAGLTTITGTNKEDDPKYVDDECKIIYDKKDKMYEIITNSDNVLLTANGIRNIRDCCIAMVGQGEGL